MRTAYLVRKNTWMSDGERRVARKIAREGENRLSAGFMTMDAVSAVVFYSAGCAAAVLGRVSERYVQMLAAGEDVSVMQEVFERAQGGMLMAARAMEVLIAGRVGLAEERERNWFAETQEGFHHKGTKDTKPGGSGEEKEEGLLSMVGERLGSRIGAVGLAQGAMSGLALEAEAHRVGQALGKAREVPRDGEAELMAQMDVQFAAYQAKWEAGERERERKAAERGKASTTKDTKDTKAGGSGASGTSAFPNGNSGTREVGAVEGGEFSRLSRRERRFVERLARKEAKKGQKLAA